MAPQNLSFLGQNFSIYIRDEVDQSVVAEIFRHREYRRADAIVKSANHAILDVGAHAGFFTIYCKALNKHAQVYAIEPEVNNFTLLNRHIAENGLQNIKTFQVALADNTGSGQLVVSQDSHNHAMLSARVSVAQSGLQHIEDNTKVKTFTLADFCRMEGIEKISLLKMDIEGGEYDVFASLEVADYLMIENIILEYHNYGGKTYKILEKQLRENGFGAQVFPSQFDKRMGFIFANNKRI